MESGFHNGSPYFTQLHTVNIGKPELLYKHSSKQWKIGPGPLDEEPCGFRNMSDSYLPPMNGWEYRYNKERQYYNSDPEIKLTTGPPSLCAAVNITAKDDSSNAPNDVLGRYTPTGLFSAGQQVFKHERRDKYLMVYPGRVCWYLYLQQD